MTKNLIYQGAEALIIKSKYQNRHTVQKKRISKSYRIKEIDQNLIAYRTKEEVKLMSQARTCSVSVPIIYDVDLQQGIITMQYIQGKRIKDILNTISEEQRKNLCHKIGTSIAQLHKNNIIHGDITTSNMILFQNRIYFIDFGLGMINSEIEAKAVDLHVLMEAFESTHSQHPHCFNHVLETYKKGNAKQAEAVEKKIQDIIKRGRYR